MKESDREIIKMKYGGLCAYSGTPLADDWQIDHMRPVLRDFAGGYIRPDADCFENMVPCQKVINHYKGSLGLEEFRTWFLGGLHERLAKLPKKTNRPQTIKRKEYLMKVARLFDITPDKPFNGVFYFEKVEE